MLTREEDVDAHALRRQGWTISVIARHLGRDRKTIRAYLNGERVPGQRRQAPAEIGMSGQAEGQPVLGELPGQFRLVQHPPVVLHRHFGQSGSGARRWTAAASASASPGAGARPARCAVRRSGVLAGLGGGIGSGRRAVYGPAGRAPAR
ncbi:hypothetical protein ACH4U7_23450 [Streptomyces sp. NPDC020845]|uniref:terminase gpP N-terminus-related DNA-binding protein n=1 Tax=Streptomyces sp. NPDC020845 TaxID=3365096 RepID=UPI00379E7AF2